MKKAAKTALAVITAMSVINGGVFAAVEGVDSDKLINPNHDNVLIIVHGEGENNSEVVVDCKPVILEGKVKLPLGRLMSALDYTAINKAENELTISNGNRKIQLFYNKNQAKVDDESITLKNAFKLEKEKVYDNYIDVEDVEALFSYKTAYDKTAENVVLYVTEDTPKAIDIPELTDVKKTEATLEQKLADLKKYGIFQGNDKGELNLDKEITRAEFCKVICAALGYDEADLTGGDSFVYEKDGESYTEVQKESSFTDVPKEHWAYRYIQCAYDLKLINGVGNGRFAPEASITEIDAIKIIVSALGYAPQAEQMGGYPDGFRRSAERFEIRTDNPKAAILREKVAEYLYTALDIPLMAAKGFNVQSQTSEYIILDGSAGTDKVTLRTALDAAL